MSTTSDDNGKLQRDRFIETARELGADEDPSAFDAKLAMIARQRPRDYTASKINDRMKSARPFEHSSTVSLESKLASAALKTETADLVRAELARRKKE